MLVETTIAAVLCETVVERLKDIGITGYSSLVALLVGIVIAVAANIQLVPVDLLGNEVVNQVISGVVISGGSNYVNSVRDKLKN